VDEAVDRLARVQDRLADMDELGRLLADDVDAQQAAVVAAEDELEEPVRRARDEAPRVAGEREPAAGDGDAGLLRALLGQAPPWRPPGGVDAERGSASTVSLKGMSKAWYIATRPCSADTDASAGDR
jgi:hypothetical protein